MRTTVDPQTVAVGQYYWRYSLTGSDCPEIVSIKRVCLNQQKEPYLVDGDVLNVHSGEQYYWSGLEIGMLARLATEAELIPIRKRLFDRLAGFFVRS